MGATTALVTVEEVRFFMDLDMEKSMNLVYVWPVSQCYKNITVSLSGSLEMKFLSCHEDAKDDKLPGRMEWQKVRELRLRVGWFDTEKMRE